MTTLRVKLLSENATVPTRGSDQSAGWDLYAADDVIVPARGKAIISTDIAVAISTNYYGRIAPRSGMSWKNHTDIGAGVIDSDYRGPVGVVMFNHADSDLQIDKGDRVAQLVIEQISTQPLVVVEGDLDDTERGEGGFGSTGK
tara:strand:- start:192 stop:620 length:429 start_codon:yes stop_codon:yes gene_type:complete